MNGLRLPALALVAGLAVALGGCASDEEKIARHIAAAEKYQEEGDLRSALVELQEALGVQPKSAPLNRRIGELFTAMGRPARAAFFYGEAYRLDPSQTDAALLQAPALFGSDLDAAEALVREVLEKEPQKPEAHATLAEVMLMRADTEAALRSAFTAIELDSESLRARRLLTLVHRARIREAALQRKKAEDSVFQAALAAADDAAKLAERLEGQDPWWDRMEQARIYAEWEGHDAEAHAALQEAYRLADEADSMAGRRALVIEARRLGASEPDPAFRRWVYERWVEVEPESVLAWRLLATLALQMDGSDGHIWKRAFKERPDDARLHAEYVRNLAERTRWSRADGFLKRMSPELRSTVDVGAAEVELAMAKGNMEEAEATLAKLRKAHPNDPLTRVLVAALDLRNGRTEQALKDLRILSGEVERADVLRLLAAAEIARGNNDAALAAVERAIELAPAAAPAAHETRIRLLAAGSDWPAVMRAFRDMRQLDLPPPSEGIAALRMQALYETGRGDLARRQLEAALERAEPTTELVFLFLRYEGGRQRERAEKLLRDALDANPGDVALTAALVRLELASGDPGTALERMDAYEERTGESAGRILHARLLFAQGREEEAEAAVIEAFNSRPRPFGASPMLVEILSARGKTEEAIRLLSEARDQGNLQPAGLWQLGRLHYARGELEAAHAALEAAHQANPSFEPAIGDLALVLSDLGRDLDRAVTLARRMKARNPENSAIADTLGYVYLRKGLAEPAAFEFQSAIELERVRGNEVAEYHYHLGLALRAQGRTAEARQSFSEALRIEPEHEAARQAIAQAQEGEPGAG